MTTYFDSAPPLIIPKDWPKWCRKMGMRIHHVQAGNRSRVERGAKSRPDSWLCLKGKGFVWRITCHGNFQRGDRIENFDRWALCDISESPMPKNWSQFKTDVEFMADDYAWTKSVKQHISTHTLKREERF